MVLIPAGHPQWLKLQRKNAKPTILRECMHSVSYVVQMAVHLADKTVDISFDIQILELPCRKMNHRKAQRSSEEIGLPFTVEIL